MANEQPAAPRKHKPGCWLAPDHDGACRRKTKGAHGLGLRGIFEDFLPELGDPYASAAPNHASRKGPQA